MERGDWQATVHGVTKESDMSMGGTPLQYFCLENPMDGGAW